MISYTTKPALLLPTGVTAIIACCTRAGKYHCNIATGLDGFYAFFFSCRRRHTRSTRDWSSDVCSSDLERRDIWSRVFPPQAEVEELDLDFLARLEITGGNIRTIAVNSAFLAAEEGSPIRLEHVLHAARREYAKIAKLVSPAEFGPH